MSSLLSAGVQVSPAIRGLADQTKEPEFKKVIEAVWKRLETGVPLHDALKEHPQFFPEEIANMIQAGEESDKRKTDVGAQGFQNHVRPPGGQRGSQRSRTAKPGIFTHGRVFQFGGG